AVANEEKMHVASLPVKLLEHFPPAGRGVRTEGGTTSS
ncbi:hypothetical protein Q604_UNBC07164G0002, partial [human gut metagenome]